MNDRFRQLADDSEEQARRSQHDLARNQFHKIAAEARMLARGPALPANGQSLAIEALEAQARFASWLNGDAPVAPEQSPRTGSPALPCRVAVPATIPPDALNARQLAQRFGIVERTAFRAIERGLRYGWPGFHRVGCHLYAQPEAFPLALRRGLSELRPNGAIELRPRNDSADHSQAA